MKRFALVVMLGISSYAMAWSFGGLDVKEMKEIQEATYQSGRSCLRGDTLDACAVFLEDAEKHTELFVKHADEISEGIKEGDSDCEQIKLNAEKINELINTLLARNKR